MFPGPSPPKDAPLRMARPRGCRGQDAGSSGSTLSLGSEPSSPGLLKGTEDPKRQGVQLSLQQEYADWTMCWWWAGPGLGGQAPGNRPHSGISVEVWAGGRDEASHKMYAELCGELRGQERRSHGTQQPNLEGAVCHISDCVSN